MEVSKKFFCIDAHTCGNPVRVVAGGAPFLEGKNMSEKRLYFLEHFDWIRKGLMFEPRGHDMMSGSILYPPSDTENDIAILFIETSGCLPMCGHGIIGTITVAIEEGLIAPKIAGTVRAETPAGVVTLSYVQNERKKVVSVKLTNIPSYLHSEKLKAFSPDLGELLVDVAYGGNFYAVIEPQQNFSGIENYTASDLIRISRPIRTFLNDNYSFVHPQNDTIKGLGHLLWTGKTIHADSTARNAVFYGDKAIDRSPCGTGTSARMAQLYAQGRLQLGEPFINESYIGSIFNGLVESETTVENYKAIIPSIEGWAKITGYNTILIDTDDPYAFGFQVI